MERLNQPASLIAKTLSRVSLRAILVVPFVAQVSAAVGLTGWFSLHNGQQAVNNLSSQLLTEVSERVASHLDYYLASPNQINQINLAAFQQRMLNPKDFHSLGRYFWTQMHSFQVSYISFGTPKGEFIGVERLDNGKLLLNEVSAKTGLGELNVYASNSWGDRAKKLEVKYWDPRVEAWYTETARAGKPIWSSIYQWEDKPEVLSISANSPIFDGQKLVGILSVDHTLTQISDYLSNIHLGATGKIFILERNGLLVASSTKLLPFQMQKNFAHRLKASESNDEQIRMTTQHLTQSFGSLNSIRTSQQISFSKNQHYFAKVTPWKDTLGLDWLIVIVVPESNFMEQIDANTRITILLCFLALATAILLGLITAHWIIQPIQQFVEASQAIANGDLEQTIPGQRIKELEVLSQSFNQMAEQLRESFIEMESRVQERTIELAKEKEVAEAANLVKSKFLENVSHELRTPLNIILGFSQVIHSDSSLTNEQQEAIAKIRGSGESLLSLINNMIKVARLESSQVSFHGNQLEMRLEHGSGHSEITTPDTLQHLLSQLPPDWTAQLYQAAVKGADYQILQLMDQLSAEYAPLTDTLKIWVYSFHFNKILNLIQQVTS